LDLLFWDSIFTQSKPLYMGQIHKSLSKITLEDAFDAYQQCSLKGKTVTVKRLAQDRDGRLILQRQDTLNGEWHTVVVFASGFAYIFGGDSPERFEKNVKFNFILFSKGYRIYFKSLDGLPNEILDGFSDALFNSQEK
jgi:hypothetical protein